MFRSKQLSTELRRDQARGGDYLQAASIFTNGERVSEGLERKAKKVLLPEEEQQQQLEFDRTVNVMRSIYTFPKYST